MTEQYKESKGGDITLEDLVSTGKPSLAHLAVVDKLVRDFAAQVLLVKTSFHEGRASAKDPLAVIEGEAKRMGDIVLGRNAEYDAQPWNTDARLGNTIRVLLPNETIHYKDPGVALFMWFANQVLKAGKALDDGDDEAAVQQRLGAVTDDVVGRIMGIRV